MQFINQIISKPDYKSKINNEEVVNKWKLESEQPQLIETIVSLLKIDKPKDNDLNWHLNFNMNIDDKYFNESCYGKKCKCRICKGYEQDYCDDCDTDVFKNTRPQNEDCNNCKELLEIMSVPNTEDNCSCYRYTKKIIEDYLNGNVYYFDYDIGHDNHKQSTVMPYIVKTNQILSEQTLNFQKKIKEYEAILPADYHPRQVRNLNHPSLNCFVKNVSKLKDYSTYSDLPVLSWIPSDFKVQKGLVKIASPINNLREDVNKKNLPSLYPDIEKVMTDFLPKFNQIIEGINKDKRKYFGQGRLKDFPENAIDEITKDFQAIVKFASTELKPGQKYEGGKWHLEGIKEEHIISTGIWYFDIKNITESKLSFRTCLPSGRDQELEYQQCNHDYVLNHYGLDSTMSANITLGSIKCEEGKAVVFPNFFQHKIEPFELVDNTKPGHRKVMVIFLIDPSFKLPSTANVENSMTEEQALYYREVMTFVKGFEAKNQSDFHEREINLCEH
jgi:hypothetical protein